MTIEVLSMILALGIGLTSASAEPTPTTEDDLTRPGAKIAGNCYINGTLYNPCPTDPLPPPRDEPIGKVQQL